MKKLASIYFKKHERRHANSVSTIIAMADAELLGKKLTGKNGTLNLITFRSFYEGQKLTPDEAGEVFADYLASGDSHTSFNLVGKETLTTAAKYVNTTAAKKIGSVPHLQIYQI